MHAKCLFPNASETKLKILYEFNTSFDVKCCDCKNIKKQKLNALVSKEDFNQMFLVMESKWLEDHKVVNSINENLCNLKKCIAVPDHSFQKKKRTKQYRAKDPIFPI